MKTQSVYLSTFLTFLLVSQTFYPGFCYEATETSVAPDRIVFSQNINIANTHSNSTEIAPIRTFTYYDILELIREHDNIPLQLLTALSEHDRALLFHEFTLQDYLFLANLSNGHREFICDHLATIGRVNLEGNPEFALREEYLTLAAYLPNLRHLSLNNMQLNEYLVIQLIALFPDLVSLNLSGTDLSLNTLATIVNTLHNLRELRVEPNPQLTHEALSELLRYRMHYDTVTKTWKKLDSKPSIARSR